MKVETKLAVILFFLLTLPLYGALHLTHLGWREELETGLAVAFILSVILLKPLGHLLGNVIFMNEIRAINRFCVQVKQGDYAPEWPLPPEGDDEHELMRLKRNLFWMAHAISSREERLRSALDVTSQSMQEFERLSLVDGLTGVGNRRAFEARLCEAATRSATEGAPCYLMLIDCDGFKQVNDQLGHAAGDDLLVRLGDILRASTRAGVDLPFRFGGDEFGVVFSRAGRGAVLEAGERIRRRFAELAVGGATLSIGVAESGGGEAPEVVAARLKEQADVAVYAAKAQGKDRVSAFWDPDFPASGQASAGCAAPGPGRG
jgi:diguanylate cyclase (GGDEF)-like protein